MFRHSVSWGGARRQTGDTVFRHDEQMTTRKPKLARKPRLDWIKEVLADPADEHAPSPLPARMVWRAASAAADFQSLDDRVRAPEGHERLFCPSWQQMRLAATPRP
jgi:hypothetical protein